MIVFISAILILIMLVTAAVLAFIVPLKEKDSVKESVNYETDSVLAVLVRRSRNVPAVIDILE